MLKKPSLRLRVSEEYPIIDQDSGQLLGYINQFTDRDPLVFYSEETEEERYKGLLGAIRFLENDYHQDVPSLARALQIQRSQVFSHLHQQGCRAAVAGTHPDSEPQKHTRVFNWYSNLVGESNIIARRLQIYATTVSVGIEDRDLAISTMNSVRYLLPHVLCLSTSSPFWNGEPTGLKSYRQVLRDSLLRTDLPPHFTGIGEYEDYFNTLIETNCIKNSDDVRWDVRWDEKEGAMVFSICDAITRLKDVVTIAALLQCLVAWCDDLRLRNMQFRTYDRLLIMENKWRAIRYGVEGRLIDFGKEQEVPLHRLIWELGSLIDAQADALGTLRYIERCFDIAEAGSSADHQLRVWEESNSSINAVIDFIADASEEGCEC